MNFPASSAPYRYSMASLVCSHRDSELWIVVSVPAPKAGGEIEKLTSRFVVAIPAAMSDLVEGDVCRFDGVEKKTGGEMTKVGSLA
jgi:hypothetical protein